MLKQPETRAITQDQYIYAGLVMVEIKCIEIDQQQSQTKNKLSPEQWQALIALHRTLLHEHHDFFLASQHPSASPALRRLATKYAMPFDTPLAELDRWVDQAIVRLKEAASAHRSQLLDLINSVWRRSRTALERACQGKHRLNSFRARLSSNKFKDPTFASLAIILASSIPGAASQETQNVVLIDNASYWKEFCTTLLDIVCYWSIPTMLSTGVLTITYRKSSARLGICRGQAVTFCRKAAGIGSMAAVILADPRCSVEWAFPTTFTSISLQLLYWHSLLSGQDQNLRWLAIHLATAAGLDGFLCHLGSANQGSGYGLFMQLLPFSIWLTLTLFSYFLPEQTSPARLLPL
jgi:hypothetical protein